MVFVIVGLFLFLILVLLAVKIGMDREKTEAEPPRPMIHASGIYSVVRRNVRESVERVKPPREEVAQYLSTQNVDLNGKALSAKDKERLLTAYFADMAANTAEIEAGDREEVEYYYYDFVRDDPGCAGFVSKGQFVSREEIFKYAILVPPFHVGCACRIKGQHVTDNVRKTISMSMRPLPMDDASGPRLPKWNTIVSIP
jgi:hypothetical protein